MQKRTFPDDTPERTPTLRFYAGPLPDDPAPPDPATMSMAISLPADWLARAVHDAEDDTL